MFLNNPPYTTFDQIRDEITTDECVLLGNGASINDLDFDKVAQYFTIGVNRIGKIFTPDVHVAVDNYITGPDGYNSTSPAKVTWNDSKMDGYMRHHRAKVPSIPFALWFAFELGFKTIYLCGVDFKGDYFWGEKAGAHQNLSLEQYYLTCIKSQMLHIADISILLCEKGGILYLCSKDSEIDFLEYTAFLNK